MSAHTPGPDYTRDGRDILRGGRPFVRIERVQESPCARNSYSTNYYAYPPTDADDLAKWIVDRLNTADAMDETSRQMLAALKAIQALMDQPVQNSDNEDASTCRILRGDCACAWEWCRTAIARAEGR